jgi:putative nucleotidyltransferase with HDIG domain
VQVKGILDRKRITIVAGVLTVCGMVAAVLDGVRLARFFGNTGDFLLWAALAILASMFFIPRSRGRTSLSMQPGVDLAAVFVFGPGTATWLCVFSRVASNLRLGWKNPDSILLIFRGVLAVGLTGWIYVLLGGPVGIDLIEMPGGIPMVLTAGLFYLLLEFGLAVLGDAMDEGRRAPRGLAEVVRSDVLVHGPVLAGGIVLGALRLHMGPLTAIPFVLIMVLAGHAASVLDKSRRGNRETVRTLMSAVDASDSLTRGHSYRIAKVCTRVARRLGYPESEIQKLEYAALLHDIGRTALQHDLLSKRGKLTREEHFAVRTHPRIGADIMHRFDLDEDSERIVLCHHEQPDGKGYPLGLKGDSIPPGSRIIMAVAAFDAMTSDRPYRRGLDPEAAFEELLNCSGSQFFPDVVEALIDLYSRGELYDEFDDQELESYWDGRSSSRALDRYLQESDRVHDVPVKLGVSDGEDDSVPTIDFPGDLPSDGHASDEFPLDSAGRALLLVSQRSDVGCIRENNEDQVAAEKGRDPEQGVLLLVADGMGGAAAGEVASGLAVETVRDAFFRGRERFGPGEALKRAVTLANEAVCERANSDPELEGMGTTLTAVVVVGSEAVVGHVGDSRAYLVSGGEIGILTRDHTLAAELAAVGGGDVAVPAGAKNVLSRCLGGAKEVEVDLSEDAIPLQDDDTFILCSDGLSNMVQPREILAIVSENDPDRACDLLVELARDRGAPDNVTVQVARLRLAA